MGDNGIFVIHMYNTCKASVSPGFVQQLADRFKDKLRPMRVSLMSSPVWLGSWPDCDIQQTITDFSPLKFLLSEEKRDHTCR